MKKANRIFALLLAAMLLVACAENPANVSENAGIGRFQPSRDETDESLSPSDPVDQPPNDETEPPETEPPQVSPTGKSWAVIDGKYEYFFAERDKTAQNDLSDMAGVSKAFFADAADPADWYPGKVSYDEATGKVTYAWDRYKSTLEVLEKYGGIYRGDTEAKTIYLTFDCGYEYGPTPDILDTLKEKNVPAIFFVTGQYVKEEPAIIQRMLDEGHIVGNHTVNHKRATLLSAEEFVSEMQRLEDMFVASFPDADPMIYYRPPYGDCSEYTLRLADKMGYRSVLWSFTYADFDVNNQLSYDAAMAKVKSGLHPGAVYLFHTESTTNAAILGEFIDWVRSQGYEFLPVCDIK